MRKKIFSFLMIGAIAVISVKAMAADNITLDASVIIRTPLTLTEPSAMNFGILSLPVGADETAVLGTDGVITTTLSHSGTPASGSCKVTGEASTSYTLTASITPLISGANSLTVTDLTVKCGSAADQTSSIVGSLDATGSQIIAFGGTLNMPASSPSGTYTGTLTISVAYQ